jgi:alpha-glucosidase
MLADHPEAYKAERELPFLKAVPAAWDETRGLAGRPGSYAVVARRSGKDWYVGAITNGSPREIDVPLDFLPEGEFSAEIWADGNTPTDTAPSTRGVTRASRLPVKMAPAGGCAVRIRPAR